jgi:hypothetical protein
MSILFTTGKTPTLPNEILVRKGKPICRKQRDVRYVIMATLYLEAGGPPIIRVNTEDNGTGEVLASMIINGVGMPVVLEVKEELRGQRWMSAMMRFGVRRGIVKKVGVNGNLRHVIEEELKKKALRDELHKASEPEVSGSFCS